MYGGLCLIFLRLPSCYVTTFMTQVTTVVNEKKEKFLHLSRLSLFRSHLERSRRSLFLCPTCRRQNAWPWFCSKLVIYIRQITRTRSVSGTTHLIRFQVFPVQLPPPETDVRITRLGSHVPPTRELGRPCFFTNFFPCPICRPVREGVFAWWWEKTEKEEDNGTEKFKRSRLERGIHLLHHVCQLVQLQHWGECEGSQILHESNFCN